MILLALGIVLWIMVLLDVGYTVFSSNGAGLFAGSIGKRSWSLLVSLSKILGRNHWLKLGGPIVISVTLLQWIVLLWTAHVLIVASDNLAIINAQSKVPASFSEKLYVTGYTLSTMGNGDFIGGNSNWKMYLAVASFSGIAVISLALTYLVQVLSNVTTKREFSSYVTGIGCTPQTFLVNAWNGRDFTGLNSHLLQLSTQILNLSESHLSYPILHFYYSSDPEKSLPVATAILDEALTIIYEKVPKSNWPDPLILRSARKSIGVFLNTLKTSFIRKSSTAPLFPELDALQDAGIPLEDKINAEGTTALTERRELLLAFIRNEGREWSVISDRN